MSQLSLFTPDIHSDSSKQPGLSQWAHVFNSMVYENDVHAEHLQLNRNGLTATSDWILLFIYSAL